MTAQHAHIPGTQGYEAVASATIEATESISFAEVHENILHVIPQSPSRILDVGACSGRDAAALAASGHSVVAVEPLPAFIEAGQRLHPSPDIDWRQDSLPTLASVTGTFDFILAHAVWMHLSEEDRNQAMSRICQLMKPGAVFAFSIRHGPVPKGKVMHDVPQEETAGLANANGLKVVLYLKNQPSAFDRTEVTWTRFALLKPKC